MTTIFPGSNFQSALIFIQIIALPFFIVLLIIHILFGGVWSDSEPCSNFCKSKPTNRHYFLPRIETPSTVSPTKDITTIKTIDSSIGALLLLRNGEWQYKCPVAILSKHSALSINLCINVDSGNKIKEFRINIGSRNWKENGILANINNIAVVKTNSTLKAYFYVLNFTITSPQKFEIVPMKVHNKRIMTYLTPDFYFFNENHVLDHVSVELAPLECCEISRAHKDIETCMITPKSCDLLTNTLLIAERTLLGIQALTSVCEEGSGRLAVLKTGPVNWTISSELNRQHY